MKEHPDEIVVIWLSKHGDPEATGEQQYPGVSLDQKRVAWRQYLSIFRGMLIDTEISDIFSDSIETLIDRSHKVITFVSDDVEFSGSSENALDAARIQNPSTFSVSVGRDWRNV